MNVIPFVHDGLGNSSYLIGLEGGSALLVDPDRTVQRYLDVASARGWSIERVLETHLHADFVSGVHELAAAAGATLFVPEGEGLRLPHEGVRGAERWTLDGIEIESVGSPGHTPEHMSYVLRAGSRPPSLFSGGSLLVGGAARTDLISPDMTDALTRAQYRTLTGAFSALPDETLLFPTHGGGSFCSAGSGGERTSTLGAERATNPVLGCGNEDEFAAWFPTTFPSAPAYYFRMRTFNQAGPRLRHEIQPPLRLSPAKFDTAQWAAVIIDTRPVDAYAKAHIPGSISIAFRDVFAVWLGWVVPANVRLLFVADDLPIERLLDECLLVGYEQFAGVLEGGLASWEAAGLPVMRTGMVSPSEARGLLLDGASALDVREPDEYRSGHIPEAVHVPLGQIARHLDDIPNDRPIVAYCGHGERAATAISLLERAGRITLLNLDGGIDAWRDEGYGVAG